MISNAINKLLDTNVDIKSIPVITFKNPSPPCGTRTKSCLNPRFRNSNPRLIMVLFALDKSATG